MRFLADENMHADVVAWLRSLGHDVLYAAESLAGEDDAKLLERARVEGRILVTDDKDFGEVVFRQRLLAAGILLIRLHAAPIPQRIRRLTAIWPAIESRAAGSFVVISDKKVRIRPLLSP